MKNIICLLIFSSSFCYSQIELNQNISENKEIEICLEIKQKMDLQNSGFKTEYSYDEIFDRILSVIGISRNFQLVECRNINNAVAYTRFEENKGLVRYIAYDDSFMKRIEKNSNDWAKIGILAHEIGHHLNFHNLTYVDNLEEKRSQEIESDEFAGFILQKLGASLSDAKLFISVSNNDNDDTNSTHPKRILRLKAIEKGYKKAKKGESIGEKTPKTEDEDDTEIESPTTSTPTKEYTAYQIGKDLRNEISAKKKYNNKIITIKAFVDRISITTDYQSNKEMKVIRITDAGQGEMRSLAGSFNCYFDISTNISDVELDQEIIISGKGKIRNGRIELWNCKLKN